MRIAIASDIHVGKYSRALDLRPVVEEDAFGDQAYIDTFLKFLQREDIIADYLVCPGDATSQADTAEFKLAWDSLDQIRRQLGVEPDHFLFVPGNHDVNWSVTRDHASDTSGYWRSQRYGPLLYPDWGFKNVLGNGGKSQTTEPWFDIWEFSDLLVIGINSSAHDDYDIALHHGLVFQDTLDALSLLLPTLRLDDARTRAVIVHHHPIGQTSPIPNVPEFSAMTNAEQLISLLAEYKFDLLIHGHRHAPSMQIHSPNRRFPLVIMGAGSFGVELESDWSGSVNNQFHLLDIVARDVGTGKIYGHARNWAYVVGKSWIESETHNGIPFDMPFGTYIEREELGRHLSPLIQKGLADRGYVELNTLRSLDWRLEYVPAPLLTDALLDLQTDCKYRYTDGTAGIVLLGDDS